MKTFQLGLPDKDGLIIDANLDVTQLKFDRAAASLGFEVYVRYDTGRSVCIARVKVTDSTDFNWAIDWVHYELGLGDLHGEFDDFQSDGPAIDIGDTYAA